MSAPISSASSAGRVLRTPCPISDRAQTSVTRPSGETCTNTFGSKPGPAALAWPLPGIAAMARPATNAMARPPEYSRKARLVVLTSPPAARWTGGDTGAHGVAVEVDGARAALRLSAAKLGSGQAQHVAQRPEQRHLRVDVELAHLAIHFQCDHGVAPSIGHSA